MTSGRKPMLTPEQDEAFKKDWLAGLAAADLAKRYNMRVSTVSSTMRRLNLPRRQRGGTRKKGAFGEKVTWAKDNEVALGKGEWIPGKNGIRVWVPST